MTHNQLAVVERIALEHDEPITWIDYDPEPGGGFTCLTDRAPHTPDDDTLDTLTTICLHCLIDAHPELGEALDHAREINGTVAFDSHDWHTA